MIAESLLRCFCLGFAVFLAVGWNIATAADEPRRPNVLLIISDDLAPAALGAYGNTQCQTPNIDRLAERGVRFDRAYCQHPVCATSRAAMMSGLYCQQIGVMSNGQAANFARNLGDRPALGQFFKQHGYYTARCGKIYHMRVPGDITAGVSGPDHAACWTERFNFQAPEQWTSGAADMLSNERLNRDRDRHYNLGFGSAMYVVEADTDGSEQHDPQAVAKAIDIMTARRDEPFFLAVGLVRPHVPLVAPAAYYADYPAKQMRLVEQREGDVDDIPAAGIGPWTEQSRGMTDLQRRRRALAAYYAAVSFMDAQVGRLLDALDELKLTDDTIVVFKSDHGWHLGEHGFWQKMSLHEESARIALIVAAPGYQPAVRSALVEQIDLYPTLADLAGLKAPPHCMGHSLAAVMADPNASVREAAYCVRDPQEHLLRTDRWAFIQYGNNQMELYDMQQDPRQYTNLAGEAAHAETVAALQAMLEKKLATIK